VTRYLLDTNIISNVTKPVPSASLLVWLEEQADDDLFISALTVGEIRRGLLEKPKGKKRALLESWFDGPEGPQALFAGRIRSALDMTVAAVAEANGCVVVTDNEKDFGGLKFVNPVRA
jgi:toxin FitB